MADMNFDTGKFMRVAAEFGVDTPDIDLLWKAVIEFKNNIGRHATGLIKSLSDEQIDAHIASLMKESEDKRRRRKS